MFIPIGDDNSKRELFPYIVWFIFGINCLFWYFQLTLGEAFTYGFSAVPAELTSGRDFVTAQTVQFTGNTISIPQAPGPNPIYLTLLTAMFMHGSWMHIIGNMVYLLIFADQIEDELGHFRFLAFYLICGFAASIAHIAMDPSSVIPSLGASGAIAGMLGAYLIRHPNNPVRVLVYRSVVNMPAFIVLGGWILLQFVGQVGVSAGESSGIAYMAHIGGFIAGVLSVNLFAKKTRAKNTRA